jgi:hypothetical protein
MPLDRLYVESIIRQYPMQHFSTSLLSEWAKDSDWKFIDSLNDSWCLLFVVAFLLL